MVTIQTNENEEEYSYINIYMQYTLHIYYEIGGV